MAGENEERKSERNWFQRVMTALIMIHVVHAICAVYVEWSTAQWLPMIERAVVELDMQRESIQLRDCSGSFSEMLDSYYNRCGGGDDDMCDPNDNSSVSTHTDMDEIVRHIAGLSRSMYEHACKTANLINLSEHYTNATEFGLKVLNRKIAFISRNYFVQAFYLLLGQDIPLKTYPWLESLYSSWF
jgi:hypothetical protein